MKAGTEDRGWALAPLRQNIHTIQHNRTTHIEQHLELTCMTCTARERVYCTVYSTWPPRRLEETIGGATSSPSCLPPPFHALPPCQSRRHSSLSSPPRHTHLQHGHERLRKLVAQEGRQPPLEQHAVPLQPRQQCCLDLPGDTVEDRRRELEMRWVGGEGAMLRKRVSEVHLVQGIST